MAVAAFCHPDASTLFRRQQRYKARDAYERSCMYVCSPGLASDYHYKQDFLPISPSHSSEKSSMSQT